MACIFKCHFIHFLLAKYIVTLGLQGCETNNTLNNANTNKDVAVISAKDEKSIKEEMIKKVNAIELEMKEKSNGAYLEDEDYYELHNNFNLIVEASYSNAKIKINDDEEFKKNFSKLKEDINALSNERTSKVIERLTSSKIFYKAIIMDDLHALMKKIDFNDRDSYIRQFMMVNENKTDTAEISESADYYSESLKYSLDTLNRLKAEIDKRKEYFSEEELEDLNSVIINYKSSVNQQILMLSRFKEVYIDDGTTVEQRFETIKTDYNDGKSLLDDIELNYNVDYQELETEY